jgi:hypothetical protein
MLRLSQALLLKDTATLEAARGSTTGEKAGACVVHTHNHWLPGMGQYFSQFRKRLAVWREASLFELSHGEIRILLVCSGIRYGIFECCPVWRSA